ncbi:hypothetical protein JW711_00055 [Candidatus Woesearchaeota archaeon]|nr:hypothetical protein [Candidatus Woesearchaeota archaeon]
MVKNHIKKINAPKSWNILRKDTKFISRPNPGRRLALATSLNTCLKDMLGKTKTTKESKYLIRYNKVIVNGVQRFDEKFPVGFFDVLSLPESNESFRMIVNAKGQLELVKITEAESKVKISKVANKVLQKGGKVQVVCTDGRSFLMTTSEAAKLSTNDTLVYSIPNQKLTDTIKLEKGSLVFLYKGKHTGLLVKVEGFKAGNILFHNGNEEMETKKSYAFVVGKDKPAITIMAKKN